MNAGQLRAYFNFKDEKRKSMSEDFKWTDELVLEFVRYTKEDAPTFQGRYADLKQFKQSKQNSNKDWEIVDSRYISEDSEKTILSVRRISDNEVFSVGDGCSGFGYEEISHFTIAGKEMIASFKSGIFSNIDFLFKKAKQKLFTTEDGKDIYEGDKVALLSTNNWLISSSITAPSKPFYGDESRFKYFSTEAAARDYIVLNKPCLSAKELLDRFDVLNNYWCMPVLIKLAEQKINNGER